MLQQFQAKKPTRPELRDCLIFKPGGFWRKGQLETVDGIMYYKREKRAYAEGNGAVMVEKGGKRGPAYMLWQPVAEPLDVGDLDNDKVVKNNDDGREYVNHAEDLSMTRAKQQAQHESAQSDIQNFVAKGLFWVSGGFVVLMGVIWFISRETPLGI